MRAVDCDGSGDVEVLRWEDTTDPTAGASEVLVDVVASAVNRADLMQRQGFYPPPPGVTDVLGLECSGRISQLGEGVSTWSVGDEVCCLLAGGGQAEYAVVPEHAIFALPDSLPLEESAIIGCAALTAYVAEYRTRAGIVMDDPEDGGTT